MGVVGFEVGGPVGYQRVAYAVGLVEGIPGEGLDQVEDLGGYFSGSNPWLWAPWMNFSRSWIIREGIFFPIALRTVSASPRE